MKRLAEGGIAGKCLCMQLRVASSEIDAGGLRWRGLASGRAKKRNLRAGVGEQVEVVGIVETERLVAGDGQDGG